MKWAPCEAWSKLWLKEFKQKLGGCLSRASREGTSTARGSLTRAVVLHPGYAWESWGSVWHPSDPWTIRSESLEVGPRPQWFVGCPGDFRVQPRLTTPVLGDKKSLLNFMSLFSISELYTLQTSWSLGDKKKGNVGVKRRMSSVARSIEASMWHGHPKSWSSFSPHWSSGIKEILPPDSPSTHLLTYPFIYSSTDLST